MVEIDEEIETMTAMMTIVNQAPFLEAGGNFRVLDIPKTHLLLLTSNKFRVYTRLHNEI
jgi:hypothetical protein